MPTGTVGAITKSKAGKAQVIIEGQTYSAVNANPDPYRLTAGDKIEFEAASKTWPDGNTTWFLNEWKLIEGARKYPTSTPPPSAQQGYASPNVSDPAVTSTAVRDAERPCISNWGAELIKAGLVKDPAELGIWVTAIKNMLR